MPVNSNADPLAQLHDIIAPSSANWWPLPIIYWLLIIVIFLLIVIIIYFIKRSKAEKKQQKYYLNTLSDLQHKHCDLVTLNQLLKGISIAYFPRSLVASLHGEAWFDFLILHSSFDENTLFQGRQNFMQKLYTTADNKCTNIDFEQVNTWIKELPAFAKKQAKLNTSSFATNNTAEDLNV
ncbi:MAG: DUF4381 domain-containing protein [Psychromonas sp.]|nr:DUF4381 domain-containing protein [Psychromonas sp.]